MLCPNCGHEVADNSQVCPYCGAAVNVQQPVYPNQTGYNPQGAYSAQPGYNAQPVYPNQAGYYPQGNANAYAPPVYVRNAAAEPDGKYKPLGAWAYWGLSLLYTIPLIGWIFALVFAVSDKNIHRRNHARAYWIGVLIAAVLVAIFYGTIRSLAGSLIYYLQ